MRKQAFFSFAIIAAVTAALIMFAAYSKAFYGYREAQNYALEARLVDQRANDSQYFLSGLLDDVILDSAFIAFGCGSDEIANATNFCYNVTAISPAYLTAAAILSTDGVSYANTSAYLVLCGNTTWNDYWADDDNEYNTTQLSVNITANYTVNTSNSAKHVDIVIEKAVFINKSRIFDGYDDGYLNVTVNNPYERVVSYFVDCAS